jgi:8-oxo-dGTP diphosphatase
MKLAVCALIPAPYESSWFLVVSRPNNDEMWGMPGGKVDPGETPLQAVVREISEEVGLQLDPAHFTSLHQSVCNGEIDYDTTTFLYTGPNIDTRLIKVEDGLNAGYCTEEELSDPIWSPFAEYNRRVFAALVSRKLRPFEDDDAKYTIESFRETTGPENGFWGMICPSDGTGYWATNYGYSWDHPVFVGGGFAPQPHWATHVAWFNK